MAVSVMYVGCCGRMRSAVKRIIDSGHYQRAVLAAILVNTLSMGIEYHDQVPFICTTLHKRNYR